MTAATLDRSWVMHRAWWYMRIWHPQRMNIRSLGRALKFAWNDMKTKMRGYILPDEMSGNERALASLEAKEFTTPAELEQMGALRTAISHKKAEPDYAKKREIITAAPCKVTFVKTDGSLRTMQTEPGKLLAKGEAASKSGKRATKTRAARHPNLLPVWDADAQAPRSVNLATIQRIETPQGTHTFAA